MNGIIAIALAVFGITLLIGYSISRIFKKNNPALQRLHKYVADDQKQQQEQESNKKQVRIRPTLVKLLQTVSEVIPVSDQHTKGVKASLLQAGLVKKDAAKIFASTQMIFAGLLLVFGIFLAVALKRGTMANFAVPAIFGMIGYNIPVLWLKGAIKKRKQQIVLGLPDALDLMVVCVEAGLGLNAALLRVGEELDRHCPVVSEEFLFVNREMRAGIARQDSLRHLADRCPVDDIQSFVAVLIQTDRLGSSMARTLRTQSDSLRTKRKQRADEAAAKTSIKFYNWFQKLYKKASPYLLSYKGSRVNAQEINDYIKDYYGEEFTAKDFRTWGANIIFLNRVAELKARELKELKPKELNKIVKELIEHTADKLNNTPSVLKSNYLCPHILDKFKCEPQSLVKKIQRSNDIDKLLIQLL